jgi:hypothetical protein
MHFDAAAFDRSGIYSVHDFPPDAPTGRLFHPDIYIKDCSYNVIDNPQSIP